MAIIISVSHLSQVGKVHWLIQETMEQDIIFIRVIRKCYHTLQVPLQLSDRYKSKHNTLYPFNCQTDTKVNTILCTPSIVRQMQKQTQYSVPLQLSDRCKSKHNTLYPFNCQTDTKANTILCTPSIVRQMQKQTQYSVHL